MAKFNAKFTAKGVLALDEMAIYEPKKVKDGEIFIRVDLQEHLEKFNGDTVTINISRDQEIDGEESPVEDE